MNFNLEAFILGHIKHGYGLLATNELSDQG